MEQQRAREGLTDGLGDCVGLQAPFFVLSSGYCQVSGSTKIIYFATERGLRRRRRQSSVLEGATNIKTVNRLLSYRNPATETDSDAMLCPRQAPPPILVSATASTKHRNSRPRPAFDDVPSPSSKEGATKNFLGHLMALVSTVCTSVPPPVQKSRDHGSHMHGQIDPLPTIQLNSNIDNHKKMSVYCMFVRPLSSSLSSSLSRSL